MAEERTFTIHGAVSDARGEEVEGAEVTVWWQRLRERIPIARGHSGEEGRYRLHYRLPDDDIGQRVLIRISAAGPRLEGELVSGLVEAQPSQEVDLQAVPHDTSELATLLRLIRPELRHLSLSDLVENDEHQDLSFLAQETQRTPEQIMRVVVAARLQLAFDVPMGACYAFVRQRVPAAMPSPLLEASQQFTLIDGLVRRIGALIFALDETVQRQTLEAAVKQNLVGDWLTPEIPRILEQLQAHRTTDVLDQPYVVGKTSLRELLNVVQIAPDKQTAFAHALLDNNVSMRNFWRTLGDGQHGFTPTEASAIQRTLELGAFVKNHLPLVEALQQRLTTGATSDTAAARQSRGVAVSGDEVQSRPVAELARMNVQEWIDLVRQVGPPPNIDGTATADAAEVFARVAYTRVTRAYPTVALASRVATSTFVPQGQQPALAQFFTNNSNLELGRDNLAAYLHDQGDKAFAGIDQKDQPAVVDLSRRMQRVVRIAPDVDTAHTLLDMGIQSATQMSTLGKQQFFTLATNAGLTKREANRVFEVGAQRYAGVVSFLTRFRRDLIGIWPRGIGATTDLDEPTADAVARDQSLATLFGSQDYCSVDGCTSVLSPAAYLCDLLLWLRNHRLHGSPFSTALDALFVRRPDIGHLLLNCPNTETALPYIDLVNELLEDAVAPPAVPVWKQTTRSAAELRALPEHINATAYTTVAAASYPHTLPYNTVLDELRTYLDQSGVALWQLRQALLPLHGVTTAQLASPAAERFSIDSHALDLITQANFVADSVAWNTANPGLDLVPVKAFLRAASLTYEHMQEVREVVWVRGAAPALELRGVDDTCNTDLQTLGPAPLDSAMLDRLHRFLRMWRHATWKMWELDMLLRAPTVGNNVLDQAAIVGLFNFSQLQDLTRLSVDRQLAWFQDIDTGSHREPDGTHSISLYAQVFLDPTIPADADLGALVSGGAIVNPNLSAHLPAIQAALQISADEATSLFSSTSGALNLANLSFVYRVVALARVAQSSIADLLATVPLTTAGTLAAALATPSATLAFVRQLKELRRSGFGIGDLRYVLTREPTTVGITETQITTNILPAVRAAIQRTHDEVVSSAEPRASVLSHELAQLPRFADASVLATANAIVDDTFTGTLVERNAFIAANFGSFMDVATAQTDLAPLSGGLTPDQRQSAIAERAQQVLDPLATFLTQTRVIAALASNLQLQNDVAALLVHQLHVPVGATTMLTSLTDPSLIARMGGDYTPLTTANFPDQYHAVQLLDKLATVIRKLHLVRSDLAWLLDHAAAYGGFSLQQVPVVAPQPAQPVAALLATLSLVKLDRSFASAPADAAIPDLYALVAGIGGGAIATEASAQSALSTLTGWRVADTGALASAIGVSFAGGDYTDPRTYERLRTLQVMVATTGGDGAQLVSWGVPIPTAAEALSAQGAVQSRYSGTDWLTVAPKIMDPIRERRSAALQAYLLAQRDGGGAPIYADSNALFEHFLIDVEMSSCEVSTRVIQAYAAVQLFVERCLMALEHDVPVDLANDDTWTQWRWMKRYRIWEAARKVFLYPENWLIEPQRPNRTELFQKLEQEVRQSDSTIDNLETIALNYIDRLDEIAHLVVTGTCKDPRTGTIHVIARSSADPPRFYYRAFVDRQWTGWQHIPIDIKAFQAVPAIFRNRVCLFWPEVRVLNEPHQTVPSAQTSASPPNQDVAKYVAIGVHFSVLRSGSWTPAQSARSKLFDVPLIDSNSVSDSRSIEALYTLKVQASAPTPGFGANLFVDVFRLGDYTVVEFDLGFLDIRAPLDTRPDAAVHIGRVLFDGHFSDVELRELSVVVPSSDRSLLTHAQRTYGPDARGLLPLPGAQADPDLVGEPHLVPKAGALETRPPNDSATRQLVFTSISALEQHVGPLLDTATVPFRVVGPTSDLAFDPSSYFFYQDQRRCYFVEGTRYYQWGSMWLPVPPSNAASAPFEVRYQFNRFYHPYTRLFWHQLGGGGFEALYNRQLQLAPDTIDPSHADVFSFRNTYHPFAGVRWGEDNEIVDFSRSAAYSVYNWELFFHAPLYIAERLSENQRFEDALKWFHFIFDPTRQGTEPIPQRFWITQPLNNLTTADVLSQRINELLARINHADPSAVAQLNRWRRDPFNPFLLADDRPVAYMKRVVMSYLDNLIAWADNLFSTDSREALNEATLLYIIAAEILGSKPVAIQPPQHADDSFDDLLPKLDAFANALVDIENVIPPGGGGGGGDGMGPPPPAPQTFYFKVPPNEKLLGYWTTVADRLFKLRHCQNIAGVTRQLALFDAPIDPGLLIRAQAAGVDIGSVLSDTSAPLPSYRFNTLHKHAMEAVDAVRQYGALLLTALEKRDADALAVLLATQQKQLLQDADSIFQQRIDETQHHIEALQHTVELYQSKYNDAHNHPFATPWEITSMSLKGAYLIPMGYKAISKLVAAVAHPVPTFNAGVAGAGGSPQAGASEGGKDVGDSADSAADAAEALANILDKAGDLAKTMADLWERQGDNDQKATEAQIHIQHTNAEIAAANARLLIRQQEQINHQTQVDQLQDELDYYQQRFTNADLYDWMVGQLADTYFQSYRLAYRMCKQAERCYRYELGLTSSSFIEFGYWDSLRKGLFAGEMLSHDLRRMHSSYLDLNGRRFEVSRFVSLAALSPSALVTLLRTGACDFDLPEPLFDSDYPGHYQRHITRVSVTVAYPKRGRFDNVRATLTMTRNSVRMSADLSSGYARTGANDPRFVDRYAAIPQKIVLGSGDNDAGLFLTALDDNLGDPRYLPFEGAGADSSWHLELPAESNEIDVSAVTDVVLQVYYTSLDGGDAFKQAAQANTESLAPTTGSLLLSAQAEDAAAWATFMNPVAGDQLLTFDVSPGRFPNWSRGKTVTITSLNVHAISWPGGNFVLQPQAPLPVANVNLTELATTNEPKIATAAVAVANPPLGQWTFKLRTAAAGDFRSIVPSDIGDVVLLVGFQVS